tara:strand:- start:555 stop:1040 length:486 start_codon:yes stop_codon:yes gene_type:complete
MSEDLVNYNPNGSTKQSDQKYCHACAKVIHVKAQHCPSCGAPQQNYQAVEANSESVLKDRSPNSIFCVGCGQGMHLSATSCPKCGAQNYNKEHQGSKDKNIAGLFALLLGGIGAHHFYLGNIILGILYLVFCWTFIPMIVGFIEGLIYLTQSEESFSRKYP